VLLTLRSTPDPAVKATVMNDAEMDKVTAGNPGFGVSTATGGPGQALNVPFPNPTPPSGVTPGFGVTTAPGLQ
jgi:hypothetical protein